MRRVALLASVVATTLALLVGTVLTAPSAQAYTWGGSYKIAAEYEGYASGWPKTSACLDNNLVLQYCPNQGWGSFWLDPYNRETFGGRILISDEQADSRRYGVEWRHPGSGKNGICVDADGEDPYSELPYRYYDRCLFGGMPMNGTYQVRWGKCNGSHVNCENSVNWDWGVGWRTLKGPQAPDQCGRLDPCRQGWTDREIREWVT